jgi:hypothetical protein
LGTANELKAAKLRIEDGKAKMERARFERRLGSSVTAYEAFDRFA